MDSTTKVFKPPQGADVPPEEKAFEKAFSGPQGQALE